MEELAELIRQEAETGMRYMALAERTQGKIRSALKRLAAGSSRLLKHLQQEYYMRSGDSCPSPRFRPQALPVAEELRRLCMAADRAEQRYLQAAAAAGPGLRELYAEAAALRRRQGQTLRELARLLFR